MLQVRKSGDRGHANHGWLDSYHSFSFAGYYDPEQMGFRSLRVINEDRIAPLGGFPTHGHQDMEIITYVLSGALEHKDSLGTGSVIRPGEVQQMSAGTGIKHSEYNPSDQESTHLLQIWIVPNKTGIAPRYAQKTFPIAEQPGQLHLVVTGDGRHGTIPVQQDINLYAGRILAGEAIAPQLDPARYGWLQVARGELLLNDLRLNAGDGIAIGETTDLNLTAITDTEVLLFDLP